MSKGLKLCPFCSGIVEYNSFRGTGKGWLLFAKCNDCKTCFQVIDRVYNTRPAENALIFIWDTLSSANTHSGLSAEETKKLLEYLKTFPGLIHG